MESLEWTEWHLTPEGWMRGTSATTVGRLTRAAPPDRVKTCVFHVCAPVAGLPATRLYEKVTFDPTGAREFEARFGPCPREL